MRRPGAGILAAALWTAQAMAQTPAAPREAPAAPPGATVTATGCLMAGDRPGTFVLLGARLDGPQRAGQAPGAHHGPSEAPAKPAGAGTPPEDLRLAGATARLKLGGHVGHIVTATGMLAREDRTVSPGLVLPGPAGGTATTKPDVDRKPAVRVLNVRSVTHVAGSCTQPLAR